GVRQGGHRAVAHGGRHSLDRMGVAEQLVDLVARQRNGPGAGQERGLSLDVLARFGDEEIEKVGGIQRRSYGAAEPPPEPGRTLARTWRTRSEVNGLTMKSFAPAEIDSTTSASWPMALHMTMTAAGSTFRISRVASMPSS